MTIPLNPYHPRSIAKRVAALALGVPVMTASQTVMLSYHGVTQGRTRQMNTRFVSARRLRNDIRALRRIRGLRFVSVAQALDPDVPGPKVALTFDDGLRCMVDVLLPLLEAENVPACLYITTLDAHPGQGAHRRMLWADRIDVAAYQSCDPIVIGDETFRLDRHRIWRRAGDGALLKALCIARDIRFLDALAAACDPGPAWTEYWELLSAQDLCLLAKNPLITLGAHGVTHANLPSLSPEDRWTELTVSKTWLENVVQKEVTSFAYPHGEYTPACIEEARRAGFTSQALMDYFSAQEAVEPDLFRRVGNHPRCGSRVQRAVIAKGRYGHEQFL